MKKQSKALDAKGMIRWVPLLAVASFVVHVVLNVLLISNPTVVIDEGLYTNIARSLAWEGELAFRAQPINYPFLLYPLLLVPVYWLNFWLGGDIYRYVQVFSTLLVTSSVIPAFLFARDFSKDEKKAFLAAALVALMPDMVMGGYEMTECVLWPLALWLLFFGYRFFVGNRYTDGLMTALMAALMFFAKPGAIVMGAVLLLGCLLLSIRNRERSIKPVLASLLVLLALIGAIYGLYLALLHQPSSLIGLYAKQTSEWQPRDILVAMEATLLLAFLFVFACGGVFGILPLAFLKHYSGEQRSFIKAAAAGVVAVIIGVAVFVVPYKWDGSLGKLPLHMRYCSMFIPAFYVFSMAIDVPYSGMDRGRLKGAMIGFVALSLFPGVRTGFVYGKSGSVDSFALSAFTTTRRLNGAVMGWLVTIALIIFVLYVLLNLRVGWSAKMQRRSTVCFALFLLLNAVCAQINANVYIDPTISIDAQEVNERIGHQESLGVTQRYYDDIYSYWLDGHLNGPMQQVTIDQMFIEMEATNGVYAPFVPVEQAPNVNNHATPDTNLLVLGMTIAEHLELSDAVQSTKTSNGHFTVVELSTGDRWVDSMLYGLDDNTLYAEKEGYLHIFDTNRNQNGTLFLQITAYGAGTLRVQDQQIELSKEQKTYWIQVPFASVITVGAEGGNVMILSYSTGKGS